MKQSLDDPASVDAFQEIARALSEAKEKRRAAPKRVSAAPRADQDFSSAEC